METSLRVNRFGVPGEVARIRAVTLALIGLSVWMAALPVLLADYAYQDDYPALATHNGSDTFSFNDLHSANGRPLGGMLIKALFAATEAGVEDLVWLRLFSVVGLTVSGMLAGGMVLHRLGRPVLAWLAGILVAVNPATGVYAGWAICAVYSWAAILFLLAGWWAVSGGGRIWRWIAPVPLVVAGLMIYQPLVGFYWVAPVLYSFCGDRTSSRWLPVAGAFTLGLGLGVYYLLYRSGFLGLIDPGSISDRAGLPTDWAGRLVWFLTDRLPEVLAGWGVVAGGLWRTTGLVAGGGLALLALAGIWRMSAKAMASPLSALLLAIGFGALPLLVTAREMVDFRVLAGLYAIWAVWVVSGLEWVARMGWRPERTAAAVALLVGLVQIVAAHYSIREGLVKPHAAEYRAFRERGLAMDWGSRGTIFFLAPVIDRRAVLGAFGQREYGSYSSWLPWVAGGLVNAIARPEGESMHWRYNVVPFYSWQGRAIPEGYTLIDGFEVLTGFGVTPVKPNERPPFARIFGLEPADHPILGRAERLGDGWWLKPGVGYFRERGGAQYLMLQQGVVEARPAPENQFDLRLAEPGWVRVSPNRFPEVLDLATGTWFRLEPAAGL